MYYQKKLKSLISKPYKIQINYTHNFNETSTSIKAKKLLGKSFSKYLLHRKDILNLLNMHVIYNVDRALADGNEISPDNSLPNKSNTEPIAIITSKTNSIIDNKHSLSHKRLLNDIQQLIEGGADFRSALLYSDGNQVGFYKNNDTGKYYPLFKGFEPTGHPGYHFTESEYFLDGSADISPGDSISRSSKNGPLNFLDGSTTPTIRVSIYAPHIYLF